MLVLERMHGQTLEFHLPGQGVVSVTLVKTGRRVKLSIDAPPEVRICRKEVREKLDAQQSAGNGSVRGASAA